MKVKIDNANRVLAKKAKIGSLKIGEYCLIDNAPHIVVKPITEDASTLVDATTYQMKIFPSDKVVFIMSIKEETIEISYIEEKQEECTTKSKKQ